MKHLLTVILSVLVIVASLHIAPSAVQAQSPETAPACDIIYHDMTHYIALPVGCVSNPSTPTAPLRDAPDGYAILPMPFVVYASTSASELPAPECIIPAGITITLDDAHTIYYAPDARAVTPWTIPAGSTARLVESDGDWMHIGWACDTVWVNTR